MALLVAPSKQLAPFQTVCLQGDCPVLLYGQSPKREDTDMFVFQFLSTLSGPWRGVLLPEQSRHTFLGAYLARFLKLPLLLQLNHMPIKGLNDVIWALSGPSCYLLSENKEILTYFAHSQKQLRAYFLPDLVKEGQKTGLGWLALLQNKYIIFE